MNHVVVNDPLSSASRMSGYRCRKSGLKAGLVVTRSLEDAGFGQEERAGASCRQQSRVGRK